MSNLALRTATRTQLELHGARDSFTRIIRALAERMAHEETGQDMIEYAGVVVVVAVLIGAVAALVGGLGGNISSGISKEISKIFK